MTKSLLIIDTPTTCFECKFGDTDRICEMCIAADRQIHDEEGKFDELDIEKPLWCPLISVDDFVNLTFPKVYESLVKAILMGYKAERTKEND